MANFFIKQQYKWANGSKSDWSFHRIDNGGKITTISASRKTISSPNTLMIKKGFQVITQQEFEEQLNKIL